MFEDDMHFRPLHTSILNINKVFEPWVCCLKCIWVHPYTVTPAKLAPDLVIIGPFSTVKMMPLRHSWGCQPPQSTTHILIRHKQSVLVIGMLSQGNMGAPFYRYTGQVGPRFVKSGSLVEWKWCHYIMAEADINLRPFHTSIFDVYKGFEPLVCSLKGTWVHPYTVTPAKLAPDFGIWVHLRSGNDAITSCLGLISTSDPFIYPYYAYKKCLSHWYAVSRACGCTLIPLHRPGLPQIWEFRFTYGVKMMSLHHGWGWYPPQTTSYIDIRHIQSVWAFGMLSQGHVGAPLYRYTGQVGTRFGDSRFTWGVAMMP